MRACVRALRRGQTSSLWRMCFRKVSRGLLTAHEGEGHSWNRRNGFPGTELGTLETRWDYYFFSFFAHLSSCDEAGFAHLRKRLKTRCECIWVTFLCHPNASIYLLCITKSRGIVCLYLIFRSISDIILIINHNFSPPK